MGIDVSNDTITSEIRSEPTQEAPLLATWAVAFVTDGTDGKLILTLDNTFTEQIAANSGFMDLKRVLPSGEPVAVFDKPLEVTFRGTVTE
jgi:hypothetical protein